MSIDREIISIIKMEMHLKPVNQLDLDKLKLINDYLTYLKGFN